MKTAVINSFGKPEEVVELTERDIPTAADDGVVVKIHYAAVNPVDTYVIQGLLNEMWGLSAPFYPGYDFSGTVHAVGKDVQEFKEGDAVWAVNWGSNKPSHVDDAVDGKPAPTVASSIAEYISISASKLSRKPDGIGHDLAAAVALVGTTAYQGVDRVLTEKANDANTKILILGGSTAVGQLAIQLAKAKGVWVATTCSKRTREFVETLGADLIVDYNESKWDEMDELKGIDAVFDTVGDGNAWERSTKGTLSETGNFASITGREAGFDPKAHPPRPHASWYCLLNNTKVQDDLAQWLVDGKLKLGVEESFPFTKEGVIAAFAKQSGRKSIGKNVIKIGA